MRSPTRSTVKQVATIAGMPVCYVERYFRGVAMFQATTDRIEAALLEIDRCDLVRGPTPVIAAPLGARQAARIEAHS